MPRYSLDDPNLNRHQIAMLLALVSMAGGEIFVKYDEMESLTGAEELVVENSLAQRHIRITMTRPGRAIALPSADLPALEGKE